jgi:hypothetical protein
MIRVVAILAVLIMSAVAAHAGHPLITDDTGTQGKGRFQLELNYEFSSDKETIDGVRVEERASEASTTMSYGILDNVDLVLGVPYQWTRVEEDGVETTDVDGLSDVSVEFKWRFYERGGLALAIKPGITLPTGDEESGLGNGRASYSLMFITTKEAGRCAFHINSGYMRNEYSLAEDEAANRKDLWHLSLAAEYGATETLRLVANVGMERNPDKASETNPVFVVGGFIYSVTESFDIDLGVKAGLSRPEADFDFLAGMALRF